jgi:hypothetical protein
MKLRPWTAALGCVLLFGSASPAAVLTVREQQVAFTKGYVAALQSDDRARILTFFHPAVRACMTEQTRPFVDVIIDQQLQGFPSGKYTTLHITPVTPKMQPSLWAFLPPKQFPYPVMPTHRIQVDFQYAPGGVFMDMLEVAPSGSSWYLVTACPTAAGMKVVRSMLADRAKQQAKAKALIAKLHDPLLSKIKKLIAEHDHFGAIDAYQKGAGVDFATAATVIDLMDSPHQ